MVWADRLADNNNLIKYDPIKFSQQHLLGQGMPNWYPKSKKGWNVIWENMIKDCEVKRVFWNKGLFNHLSMYDIE
jgi:hypothetical protein